MVSDRGVVNGLAQRTHYGRLYKPGSRKGVLMLPGATQNQDFWYGVDDFLAPNGNRELVGISNAGFAMATLDSGLTWGNATILTNVSTLRTNNIASGLFAAGKVHLVGASMGGLIALLWAQANPTLVQSITLLIPCVNPQGIWDEDRNAFKAGMTTALGGRPSDAQTPMKNGSAFRGIPTTLYFSENDPITLQAEQRAFAADAGATMVSMGALGHFWGPPWYGPTIARSLLAND